MELSEIFTVIWIFVSMALVFPLLYDKCTNYSGEFSSLIHVMPYIVVVVSSIVPVYVYYKRRK